MRDIHFCTAAQSLQMHCTLLNFVKSDRSAGARRLAIHDIIISAYFRIAVDAASMRLLLRSTICTAHASRAAHVHPCASCMHVCRTGCFPPAQPIGGSCTSCLCQFAPHGSTPRPVGGLRGAAFGRKSIPAAESEEDPKKGFGFG